VFNEVDDSRATAIQVTAVDSHDWDTEHRQAIALLAIAVRAATGQSLTEGAQSDRDP
jgi:hypothetical protein